MLHPLRYKDVLRRYPSEAEQIAADLKRRGVKAVPSRFSWHLYYGFQLGSLGTPHEVAFCALVAQHNKHKASRNLAEPPKLPMVFMLTIG